MKTQQHKTSSTKSRKRAEDTALLLEIAKRSISSQLPIYRWVKQKGQNLLS